MPFLPSQITHAYSSIASSLLAQQMQELRAKLMTSKLTDDESRSSFQGNMARENIVRRIKEGILVKTTESLESK